MNIVIIGGNAAGMSAASRIKRKAPENSVTVLEATGEISYGACGLPYYIGGINNDMDLIRIRTKHAFEKSGIQVLLGHPVSAVDYGAKQVRGTAGDGKDFDLPYDKLLIASGSSPIVPSVPGKDLPGVFVLKTIGDAQHIREAVERKGDVVIVGGGYIGLELAEACLVQGVRSLRVIEAADGLLNGFDPEFGQAVANELRRAGVHVHTGEKLTALNGEGSVAGISTDKGEYTADSVILSVGVRPNTGFAAGLEQLPNGAIMTDEAMGTSLPDVYAAGDCATVMHRILGKPAYLPLGTNANKQGRLAGDAILGKPVHLSRALGTAMMRCMELELAKTGLSQTECERAGIPIKAKTVQSRTHARYYPHSHEITIKLCYRQADRVLVGAQLMGAKECAWRIDVFACAIDRGMTTEELGFLDLGYAPPFSSVWDPVHIAANAAK